MQYGGVAMVVFPNSERVECVKFNSFRIGKHCLLHVPRLASRVIRIQSFQDLNFNLLLGRVISNNFPTTAIPH